MRERGKHLYTHATSAIDYLNQRLDKTGDCWLWLKGKDKDGYGQCQSSFYGKHHKVSRSHQLSFVAFKGEIPEGKIVCHTCDNPSCCNPEHLYAGSWQDNVEDCIKRGRYISGSQKDMSFYDPILATKGKMNCFEAAKIFNLSFSRICQVWRGEFHASKHNSI